MFSKINAWRKAIAKPKKAPPMDKTGDTVKVIMSVISLTGADPRKVVERLQEIIEQIENLEEQLRVLRLSLENAEEDTNRPFEIGDQVEILNPKRGQESRGKIVKINSVTGRVTILTTSENGREKKIVRLYTNIRRI